MTRHPADGTDAASDLTDLARRIDRIRATVEQEAASVAALDTELDACAAELRRAMAEAPPRAPVPAAAADATGGAAPDTPLRKASAPAAEDDDADLFDDVPV